MAKPAVLGVTPWKTDIAARVLADSPPRVAGLVHSIRATPRTPTTTKTPEVIRTSLEWTESLRPVR